MFKPQCYGLVDAEPVMVSEPAIIQRCEQPIESVDEVYEPADGRLDDADAP